MNNGGLAISDSFTLRFENTTNDRQRISLFELGKTGTNQVTDVIDATTFNNQSGLPTLSALVWNFGVGQPFTASGTPSFTYYPKSTDLRVQSTGNFQIVSDNDLGGAVFSTINVAVTSGMTLNALNIAINNTIKASADTTNYKNAQGDVMKLYITFDENWINAQSLPINVSSTQWRSAFGISIQYPVPDLPIGSTGSPIRVSNIVSPSDITPFFGSVDTIATQSKSMANGVIVDDSSNTITYDEIKRSQTGNVLDVRSLGFSVGRTPSQTEKDSQMLQPFYFQKIDVNGNDLSYAKIELKDPYQFQDSYAIIDMGTESDIYMLDGNTRFSYDVEALTTLFITYNYAKLSVLGYSEKYSMKKVREEQEVLSKYNSTQDTARTFVMTTETAKTIKNRKNFSNFIENTKKTKNLIPITLGVVGVIFMYKMLKNN